MGRPRHRPTQLTPADRQQLLEMVRHGHESERVIRCSNSLLPADEGHPDASAIEALNSFGFVPLECKTARTCNTH